MEDLINLFLSDVDGYGYRYSSGFGYISGDGDGYGDGSGYGDDYGYGAGSGGGSGHGSSSGSGDGSGYGGGSGGGDGHGQSDVYSDGINIFNGDKIYMIDGTPTIIKIVRGNIAKGYILNGDFTLTPTFIVKDNGKFAHGETLHEAFLALQEKLYDNSTEEERLEAFRAHFPDFTKKISAKELFHWHHVLTGSCKQGRLSFCTNKGIDIDKDEYTIHEFIELTKDSYGGDIIIKLK